MQLRGKTPDKQVALVKMEELPWEICKYRQ